MQEGGSAPARGCGESPILGIELSAEDARAKLWRTSDGRVYCLSSYLSMTVQSL